jgi:hypothetical protein
LILTGPKVPKQCALLVSVGWQQGGTLGIERRKVVGKGLFELAAGRRSWRTRIYFECY